METHCFEATSVVASALAPTPLTPFPFEGILPTFNPPRPIDPGKPGIGDGKAPLNAVKPPN